MPLNTSEVLRRFPGLTRDLLYFWERHNWISPNRSKRQSLARREYPEEEVRKIGIMFEAYQAGFTPHKAFEMTAAPARPFRVFLCHSSADKENVRGLCGRLQSDGIDPWLDEKNLIPGQDWNYEILKAVGASDAVVVCLSKTATSKAGYVHKEIKEALDVADKQPEGSIFVIPVKLEECVVPIRLNRWHWVNLFEDSGYAKLFSALRSRADALGIPLPSSPNEA